MPEWQLRSLIAADSAFASSLERFANQWKRHVAFARKELKVRLGR